MVPSVKHVRPARRLPGRAKMAAGLFLLGGTGTAHAVSYNLNQDVRVDFTNTLSYNLGIRAQDIDPGIGNNPIFDESDYKFAHAGNVVTNRVEDLSELDLTYQGNLGVRVSGSAWKDFAYNDSVNYNPTNVAPGTPYSRLCSYCASPGVASFRYGGYVSHFYLAGGQLLDAFAFDNFDVANHAVSVKIGRLTRYWGNSLFFGGDGIDYSQNASDGIKGAASPGTQAKELAIPRFQFLASAEIVPGVTGEFQYFGEFYGNRIPEGGTYLGPVGFLFNGPNTLEGAIPKNDPYAPSAMHANYGIRLSWSPSWLRGVLAGYYRHLDEVQPWAPLFGVNPNGTSNYHLSYPTNVKLYGISLDKQIGNYSTGFEFSYRQHTGLASGVGPLISDLSGRNGASGDLANFIANALAGLPPTFLYDTGTLVGEARLSHVVSVRDNKLLYNGVGGRVCAGAGYNGGCSTTDSVAIAGQFDPQWLQVVPGVDVDAPIFAEYGLYGNGAGLGNTINQNAIVYVVGVHALIRQVYNVTLAYNGYRAHHSANETNVAQQAGVNIPTGTPGFPSYYSTGNGFYFYNDKGWLSLTLSASF